MPGGGHDGYAFCNRSLPLDARVAAKNDHDCSAAADPNTVGDGKCDAANNVAPCYDGGDCCEATCTGTNCGTYSYGAARKSARFSSLLKWNV